jgi:hypothetical protein
MVNAHITQLVVSSYLKIKNWIKQINLLIKINIIFSLIVRSDWNFRSTLFILLFLYIFLELGLRNTCI